MSNVPITISKDTPPPPKPDQRQAIRVERLLISHVNAHGVKIPDGPEGKSDRMVHNITAGIHSDIKTEIEYRPWLRAFRVVRSKKVTRTGPKGDLVTFEPMGKPFYLPETWVVWQAAEE